MPETRLTVRLNTKLRRRLGRLARDAGKSDSEVVREAVEAYCKTQESTPTCYDLALEAGIIGMVKDGPSDLATNPKYFEGFGRD